MGTPQFAIPSLNLLLHQHEIICVVTQPDRPAGRGHKLTPAPVKSFALEHNLPLLQPTKITADVLKSCRADLIVVVAFGQILPQDILALPKFGCINLHASLLPKLRGAAPIEWAIISGESFTGVTTMLMNAGLDTGDVLLQATVPISEDLILPQLKDNLANTGASLLLQTVNNLDNIKPVKQDNAAATYAPRLTKSTGIINWQDSARNIHNLIRGVYGKATTTFNGYPYKIWRTAITDSAALQPGHFSVKGKNIFVGTGNGDIQIIELQPPNARKMLAADFINGYNF